MIFSKCGFNIFATLLLGGSRHRSEQVGVGALGFQVRELRGEEFSLETAMEVATDDADEEDFVFVRCLLPRLTRWVSALRVTTSV